MTHPFGVRLYTPSPDVRATTLPSQVRLPKPRRPAVRAMTPRECQLDQLAAALPDVVLVWKRDPVTREYVTFEVQVPAVGQR